MRESEDYIRGEQRVVREKGKFYLTGTEFALIP